MKRKVIQIADSTQLISLPRKWCIDHGIKKGDEVEVEEHGNKIQVSTAKDALLEIAKIHFANAEMFLQRPLLTFYRMGYDQVDITFDDSKVIQRVQEEIERLMGFEIVSQTERSCTVKNVASAMDTEFEVILRRIFLMLIEMARDTSEALSKRNYANMEEITKRERLNNKLTIFCERILNKKGYPDHKRLTFIYYIVCNLEHIADNFCDICYYCMEKNPKASPQISKLVKDTTKLVERVYTLFYRFDLASLTEFKRYHALVEKDAKSLLLSAKKDELPIVQSIWMACEKLRHMSAYCIS
jgi:phosphate uptake regulator